MAHPWPLYTCIGGLAILAFSNLRLSRVVRVTILNGSTVLHVSSLATFTIKGHQLKQVFLLAANTQCNVLTNLI